MIRGLFEGWHLPVLLLVAVVLFGGRRLPDAARGLGRSLRIFKSEIKEMSNDGADAAADGKAAPSASLEGRVMGAGEPTQTRDQRAEG